MSSANILFKCDGNLRLMCVAFHWLSILLDDAVLLMIANSMNGLYDIADIVYSTGTFCERLREDMGCNTNLIVS